MATVKGVWHITKFTALNLNGATAVWVNFTDNGSPCVKIAYVKGEIKTYYQKSTNEVAVWNGFRVGVDVDRFFDFGDTPQTVTDGFDEWLSTCGTQQVTEEEVVEYSIKSTTLTAIADSIRAKKGTSDPILTEDFASEIEGISTAEYWDGSFTTKASVSLISFTIGGTSYQAEQGMTWAKWCNSDYNTGNFYVYTDNRITYTGDGRFIDNASGTYEHSTDTIIDGYVYYYSF